MHTTQLFGLAVRLVQPWDRRRLRRVERRLRRLALQRQLDRPALTIRAATRQVLDQRGVRVAPTTSQPRWWSSWVS